MTCRPLLSMGVAVAAAAAVGADLRLDFPPPWALIQRDDAETGVIPIRGRLEAGAEPGPGGLVARFNGSAWQDIGAVLADGSFRGTLAVSVGQGALEVRRSVAGAPAVRVDPVGVGDLFVVAGQSNADGRGSAYVSLDPANPFMGVKFRAGEWSPGGDPSDQAGQHASPWPILLNHLIHRARCPLGFVQTAAGSTVVRQWRGDGSMFERMQGTVRAATDGTMKVRGVLYYQGENDITHYNTQSVLGDYQLYSTHLNAMIDDMHGLLHAPVLVGQITNLLNDRARNDGIRRAQQEAWDGHPQARQGAVTYDIRPADGVHYRSAAEMAAFAGRWSHALHRAFYADAPPSLPRLTAVRRSGTNRLGLAFSRPLVVSSWDGVPSDKARGFRITGPAGSSVGGDVAATAVHGASVELTWSTDLPPDGRLWYGSGADAQGGPVLRDAETGMPAMLIFGLQLPGLERSSD